MKKRIVCVLLTLIMLLSLVPMGASAASHSTSEPAITVLKQMTTFKGTCYHFTGSEFRTGYGTVCEKTHHFNTNGTPNNTGKKNEHTITEANADLALRKALLALDEKVNSFASANGLSLSQNQHDALVVFSYNAGTGWMSGNGVLKTVIINGGTTNELLNAMNLWTNNADISRRKVEANMYVNGIYSNVVPTSFGKITYNPNDGTMAQENEFTASGSKYIMYYDTTKTIEHPSAPTKAGSTFLGWYLYEGTKVEWVPKLTHAFNGCELTAAWVTGGNAVNVNYKLAKSQLAELVVYNKVNGKADSNNASAIQSTMTVTKDYIDTNGVRWSYISSTVSGKTYSGWVKVGTYTGTVQQSTTDVDVTVTVTNNRLNSRVNATIHCATNGSYSKGDQLRIINTDYADGFLWGQVAAAPNDNTPIGWVALMYTNWNSVKDSGNTGSTVNNSTVIGNATVTVWGYLNLRNEPGTDAKIIGALAKNDTVELYEIKTVNGHQWGRCKSGWLCLTYTKLALNSNAAISDAGLKLYTFTGKVKNGAVKARVEAGDNTNFAQYADGDGKLQNLEIAKGADVTLTNFALVNGETWAKATWTNKEWKWKTSDKKEKVDTYNTRTGWVKMPYTSGVVAFALDTDPVVELTPAKFTVAAEKVNVRTDPSNAAMTDFTLNKGVEVEVSEIALGNENIWGFVEVKLIEQTGTEYKSGWVNLASKYMSRIGVTVTEDSNATTGTGLIATVINTDALKVRNTGAAYGTKIGTLARGTTVTVWESNEDGWYKVDSNQNGVFDYEDDGWVSGTYLDVRTGTVGGTTTVTDVAGNKYETNGTGKGIVANTYAGVNVRQGAGIGYASNGKLLPGTVVEILELSGNGKWGRTAQGWVSMDYITMVSYNEVVNTPTDGTTVESYDKAEKASTTAVYTGRLTNEVKVYRNPEVNEDEVIRVGNAGDNITIYELATVTKMVESDKKDNTDGATNTTTTTTTTITTTTYWARINDGWVQSPEENLYLNALDEQVHTQTGADTLKVRKGVDEWTANDEGTVFDVLAQGDQVKVTALDIIKDKVWGRIDTNEGTGWVRLDYMSEGAVYVQAPVQNTVTPSAPVLGNGSNTGGFVTNTSGYRYTGTVIRANEVNVRATPSTAATKTTSLKNGQALVIYETTVAENMAWGRCDAGWVYLYYIDLTPVVNGAVDARVVYNDNTIIYTDVNGSAVAGTYARMSTVDIYEIVGKMARTDKGWVNTDNLL